MKTNPYAARHKESASENMQVFTEIVAPRLKICRFGIRSVHAFYTTFASIDKGV